MCLRRAGEGLTRRRMPFEGTLEMLRRDSVFLLCFLREPLEPFLIILEICPAEALRFKRCSKVSWVGEGVKGGPASGTGTRRKASWELISRTMASCNVSYVGCGLTAWVDMYALLNKSIISETLKRGDGCGLDTGNGLFMTSAMLGARFIPYVDGVGG